MHVRSGGNSGSPRSVSMSSLCTVVADQQTFSLVHSGKPFRRKVSHNAPKVQEQLLSCGIQVVQVFCSLLQGRRGAEGSGPSRVAAGLVAPCLGEVQQDWSQLRGRRRITRLNQNPGVSKGSRILDCWDDEGGWREV